MAMKCGTNKIWQKIVEGCIKLSGSISSLIVVLIIVFLFKEGLGLFSNSTVESGYVVAVQENNPVSHLNAEQLRLIFDGEITRWEDVKQKSGKTFSGEIVVAHDIDQAMEQEDKTQLIAFVPKEYLNEIGNMRAVDCGNINLSDFFAGKMWMPTAQPAPQFGVLPIILGTLWVSLAAIIIALPFALSAAVYLSEIADKRLYKFLKPAIELLSGIPSVVYGFFGLVVIVPIIQKTFSLDVGETALSGAIILAIMALPTIITIAEDAMRATPDSLREASLALGANRWQTIYKVVIPHAKSGITAGVVLGIGRAIGETMAVLMVCGNAAVMPHTLLEPIRTIPASIAAELGEAPNGGAHYQALFMLACILFIITLLINLIVDYIQNKGTIKQKSK